MYDDGHTSHLTDPLSSSPQLMVMTMGLSLVSACIARLLRNNSFMFTIHSSISWKLFATYLVPFE